MMLLTREIHWLSELRSVAFDSEWSSSRPIGKCIHAPRSRVDSRGRCGDQTAQASLHVIIIRPFKTGLEWIKAIGHYYLRANLLKHVLSSRGARGGGVTSSSGRPASAASLMPLPAGADVRVSDISLIHKLFIFSTGCTPYTYLISSVLLLPQATLQGVCYVG